MSFDYSRLIATAKRLLAKFGQDMTLQAVTAPAYDPSTGGTSGAPSNETKPGVIFPYKNGITAMQASLILAGDQQVFILLDSPPKPTDKLQVGSKQYSIINVKAIEPGGVTVLYELQVRG